MNKPKKLILHGHHAGNVITALSSLKERIKFIKANKPKEEHETRLSLIRELTKDEIALLPKNIIATYADYNHAYAEWKRAYAARKRADVKSHHAYDELNRAIKDNEPALIDWHKKACGCPFYENGKNIFSKE